MKRGLQAYTDCINALNNHNLTPYEIQQLVGMIVHQLPDSTPDARRYFEQFVQMTAEADGINLPRLKLAGGIPNVHEGDSVKWSQGRPQDDEIVEVMVTKINDRAFSLDQYNTRVLCKFHSQHLPDDAVFEALDSDSVGMTLVYDHIIGSFTVEFHRAGGSTLTLQGDFLRTSFIPIKLVEQ